jgi:hypothetical protein
MNVVCLLFFKTKIARSSLDCNLFLKCLKAYFNDQVRGIGNNSKSSHNLISIVPYKITKTKT